MVTIQKLVKIRYDNNNERLNKGEMQRKDGRYCFRWTGRDKKRHDIYALSLKSLRIKESKIQEMRILGLREDHYSTTVNEIFELWKEIKRGIRERTYISYVYFYEMFVMPTFGTRKIQQITKSDVKIFYNSLVDQKQLKVGTVGNVHTVLHQVFQVAADDYIIRSNPTDGTLTELKRTIGRDTLPKEALTIEQEKLFFNEVRDNTDYQKWYPLLFIMANTGMRAGEITGLRWRDVNMEKGYISINHTLAYYNHRNRQGCYYSIHLPKTETSIRTIPLTRSVREAFLMQKEYRRYSGIKCLDRIDGYDDFIFVNRFGKVFNPSAINKAIHRIVDAVNLNILKYYSIEEPITIPQFSCHILRHTFATRLCEMGINLKVIQDLLGHKDFTTTMNIYVSVCKRLERDEMRRFDEYINSDIGQLLVDHNYQEACS